MQHVSYRLPEVLHSLQNVVRRLSDPPTPGPLPIYATRCRTFSTRTLYAFSY